MRRWLWGVAALGLVALPAAAHGSWVDARPLPGVVVGGTVDEVAFLFPEPLVVGEGGITVTGPDGRSITTGAIEFPADTVVRVGIEPLTVEGTYTVSYTLPAMDGFVFTGSYRFEYRQTAPGLEPLPYGRGSWVTVAGIGVLVLAAGGLAVARRRTDRSARDGQRSR